jgi:hypothetical protein
LFGSETEKGSERDDGEEGEAENEGVGKVGEVEGPRDRDEDDLRGERRASQRKSEIEIAIRMGRKALRAR